VVDRQVEVDEELVARERPTIASTGGDEVDGAAVHDVELCLGVGRSVRGELAPPREVVVADDPDADPELGLVEDLALAQSRSAQDEIDRALIGGADAQVGEAGVELLEGGMVRGLAHSAHRRATRRVTATRIPVATPMVDMVRAWTMASPVDMRRPPR